MNEFLLELKALMEKYNASIGFTCGPGSDTHGLYDAGIVIEVGKESKEIGSWWLEASDIDE